MAIPTIRFALPLVIMFSTRLIAATTLFEDAPQHLIEQAKKENHEYLIKELYYAKNHKFIVLKPDALLQGTDLTIDLFYGESMTFEFEKINEKEASLHWYGKHPDTKTFLFKKFGITETHLSLWDPIFIKHIEEQQTVGIFSSLYNVVRDENGKIKYESPHSYKRFIERRKNGSTIKLLTPETLRAAYVRFEDVENDKNYVIRALPNTLNVHYLIEYDENKVLPFLFIDLDHLNESQKLIYKEHKRKFNAYLASKGIDTPAHKPLSNREKRKLFYATERKSLLETNDSKVRQRQLALIAQFRDKYPKEVEKLLREFNYDGLID